MMGRMKQIAAEVLLLAASAAGAPAIVCVKPGDISTSLSMPNAMIVGKGTSPNIVADFAEQLASKPNIKSR